MLRAGREHGLPTVRSIRSRQSRTGRPWLTALHHAQAGAKAGHKPSQKQPPAGGVRKLMENDALSGEGDEHDHMGDGGADSEMPSAEAGATVTPDTNGEVASALDRLTGAARVMGGMVRLAAALLQCCMCIWGLSG